MNHVIILAGGVGSRMGLSVPKQYIKVNGKPIFVYSLMKFTSSPEIDSITIVAEKKWHPFILSHIQILGGFENIQITESGSSRQHSIYKGLLAIKGIAGPEDIVLIHDAVRPLFPTRIIHEGILACAGYDSALPVIPVKDATYRSVDKELVSSILPREELFSGQTPEFFKYKLYFDAHLVLSDDQLSSIRGSSELAFRAGLSVKMIPGSEQNLKITTIEDLFLYKKLVGDEN